MPDSLLFIVAARRHGYSDAAAEAALAAMRARLAERGLTARRLYCFRSGGEPAAGEADPTGAAPTRPRLLLAFQSADDALGFAQRRGLGTAPRLVTLSLAQALATLVQRPHIGALLVADDGPPDQRGLPSGLRIERAALIELLAGVTP